MTACAGDRNTNRSRLALVHWLPGWLQDGVGGTGFQEAGAVTPMSSISRPDRTSTGSSRRTLWLHDEFALRLRR